MPSRTPIAVVSCFLASSDAVAQRATAAQPYDLAEAYQVYSALLPREESVGFAKGTLVIQQETVSRTEPPEPCVTPDAAVRFKDAIADYKRVNSKPRLLQRQFQIDEPYEIVNSDTIDLLFKQGDWDGFYTPTRAQEDTSPCPVSASIKIRLALSSIAAVFAVTYVAAGRCICWKKLPESGGKWQALAASRYRNGREPQQTIDSLTWPRR